MIRQVFSKNLFLPLNTFLKAENVISIPLRTTFVLKRRYPVPMHKVGAKPRKLKGKHHVYELVRDENVQKYSNVDLILTSYVEGIGDVGDKISVKWMDAYTKYVCPGLAVYATPENEANYALEKPKKTYSSPFAQRTMNLLSRLTLAVVMNMHNPWTIEPWHIRVSFRKCGFHVPDKCIQLPEKPISGPNLQLENKEFYVTVIIADKEQANVRCRIHHWSTDIKDRLPYKFEYWKEKTEPIFPEDSAILDSLPTRLDPIVR